MLAGCRRDESMAEWDEEEEEGEAEFASTEPNRPSAGLPQETVAKRWRFQNSYAVAFRQLVFARLFRRFRRIYIGNFDLYSTSHIANK